MKKGFTLVELLSVIVILAITSMIIFPSIGNIIQKSKQDLYDSQLLDIQNAAEKWATDNKDLLDEYHANDVYIPLSSLRDSAYLEKDVVKNPLDRSDMDGCTRIKYEVSNSKYTYTYDEKTCPTYAEESTSEDYGYIIYEYNTSSKEWEKDTTNSKEIVSAGKFIYEYYANNNLIKVNGETGDGLYDIGDEYVFRGANPNNYVELVSTVNSKWRILSINKQDYSIKMVSGSSIGSNAYSEGTLAFSSSKMNELLMNKIGEDGTAYGTDKVVNYEYSIGNIQNNEFTPEALSSEIFNTTSSQKVGSISILDYVNASADPVCVSNFLADECKNNNYLYSMFGNSNSTWTINGNGTQIWYVNSNGTLALALPTDIKQIYSVVKLASNVYVTKSVENSSTNEMEEGAGTTIAPFKIK